MRDGPMISPRRLLLLAAACGFLSVACGDDDDAAATPIAVAATSQVAPATATPVAASERPQASSPTAAASEASATARLPGPPMLEVFPVPSGSRPHDVAPAIDGGVWYTAQGAAALGWLDPTTGETFHIELGTGSRPHGVIVDADGDAWVTDGGLNAIVRVDHETRALTVYPLPDSRPAANLNTSGASQLR